LVVGGLLVGGCRLTVVGGVKVNTVAVKSGAEEIRSNGLTNYRLDGISSSLTN